MEPLTPEQRALITLHAYQHLPAEEIAVHLGIPVASVAPRISRAMQILRRRALDLGIIKEAKGAAE